jgi:uncharacterized protein YneF (UPF0154 family)
MEQVIATMLCLGLIVGFCGGYFYGSWATERQHAKERKERQEIAELVRSAGRKPVEIEFTVSGDKIAESMRREALKRR